MPSVKVFNQEGKQSGVIELDDSVFGAEYNEALIHQVIVAQMNNKRQGTKCTLTRTEVRGGGAKPWRQKGTGRARQGSIRSPQWKGGGVVFAPKPRDFSQKVNKQAKRNALVSALSAKIADEDFVVVEDIKLAEAKTREMVRILGALGVNERVLLVTSDNDQDLMRATSNLKKVRILPSSQINVYDLVANAKCIFTKDAVRKVEEAYKA